jgi:hypothetical protein
MHLLLWLMLGLIFSVTVNLILVSLLSTTKSILRRKEDRLNAVMEENHNLFFAQFRKRDGSITVEHLENETFH